MNLTLPLLAAQFSLHPIDYSIMVIYCLFVIGIGFALKKQMKSSADFFLSGRSIPAWVTGLAFISANLGALEVMGMTASGAKYGMLTTHFYWIGAVLAMVFLAVFMMPFYYGSKARSAPEYLKLRFDEKTRALNSISFAVMTVMGSGISMHALASLLETLMGWDYTLSLLGSSIIVLAYVLKGGLTSAIYTEVLQFFLIVFGFAPVVILGLKEIGWIDGLKMGLRTVGENSDKLGLSSLEPLGVNAWTSIWSNMGGASQNAMGIDWFGLVFGLGFVLSFGYWCTNFLVVQRAMAANSMSAARRTPIIAAIPKIIFPILVIVPGLIAVALHANLLQPGGKGFLPGSEVAQVRTVGWEKLEPAFIAAKPLMEAAVAKASTSEGMVAKREASEKVLAIFKTTLATTKDGKTVEPKLNETAVLNTVYAYNTGKFDPAHAPEIALTRLTWAGEVDYNNVITVMLQRYCPVGLLGLALTALLASFMSGMAGNVTAFNTVWTYDIYQSYFAPNKSDAHYMKVGRIATVVGIIISIGAAFVAKQFNNIMDVCQLVFGFVNAPLFATFLWGMFSKRVTGHGAFWGLLLGTTTSAAFHVTTITGTDKASFIKGGFIELYRFQSDMAKNFWLAVFAFTVALVSTYVISLVTKQKKSDSELVGLVYSLTPKQPVEVNEAWYMRPAVAGAILLAIALGLNILFW